MAFDISVFSDPWAIFWIASVIVIIAIIVLIVVERRLNRRLEEKRDVEEQFFSKEWGMLKQFHGKPEDHLSLVDRAARQFFAEAYSLAKEVSYAARMDYFNSNKKINSSSAILFCQNIQNIVYSGEEVNEEKVHSLIDQLGAVIKEYKSLKEKELERQRKFAEPRIMSSIKEEEKSLAERGSEIIEDIKKLEHQGRDILKRDARKVEPAHHKFVESMDNLERIKQKIRFKQVSRRVHHPAQQRMKSRK